jgi:hypothetical protein
MWGEYVMEKVRVSVNHIFEMVTLVNNMNVRTIKVKEVMDLGDDESTSKTGAGKDGKAAEGLLN